MKKLLRKLAKYIYNKQGFKIACIRVEDGTTDIDGDKQLLKYLNILNYVKGNPTIYDK